MHSSASFQCGQLINYIFFAKRLNLHHNKKLTTFFLRKSSHSFTNRSITLKKIKKSGATYSLLKKNKINDTHSVHRAFLINKHFQYFASLESDASQKDAII